MSGGGEVVGEMWEREEIVPSESFVPWAFQFGPPTSPSVSNSQRDSPLTVVSSHQSVVSRDPTRFLLTANFH